ncbi:MAG: phosphatidylethanolamine N-methyltransferase family protein [Anaerolineales bacterium]|nr:MAG: phosphatidylethanolamine N-methyltransferase family protein [Anaerolineales bacterium]
MFIVTLLCELVLGASLVLTVGAPSHRVWPPPGRASWQYVFVWCLTIAAVIGFVAVGMLDWNSFVFFSSIRFPVGISLVVAGLALSVWAVGALGVRETQGLAGRFTSQGPYRFSRNPQYVGDMAITAGLAVVFNSGLAWILAAVGIILFAVLPLTEEPWLREQYGSSYEEYACSVPRFISLRRKTAPQ